MSHLLKDRTTKVLLTVSPEVKFQDVVVNVIDSQKGSISVSNVSGGVGCYSYLWNDGSDLPNLQNLDTGVYSVRVSDSVGCFTDRSFVIRNLYSNKVSITVFPNPVSSGNTMMIRIGSVDAFKMNYILTDISGRIVFKDAIDVRPGFTHMPVIIPMSAGICAMKFQNPDGSVVTKKVIVF